MTDYMKEAERLPELHREIVDDALEVVDTFGPWGMDINEDLRRQIVLADEVRQLRKLYSAAVKGRQEMRSALRDTRAALNAAQAPSTGSAEADRLVDEYGDAVSDVVGFAQDPAGYSRRVEATRAALLAHIQRGAVPEGWSIRRDRGAIVVEHPKIGGYAATADSESIAATILYEFASAMLDAAPDQFRDAAKMMAEPAEVPMPEPDATLHDDGYFVAKYQLRTSYDFGRAGWRLDVISMAKASTYGDAREAAGYAQGLAEAGRDAERYRWLCKVLGETQLPTLIERITNGYVADYKPSIDAAIDAALRGEVKP